jgi:anti-sigma regulatory factor (Ser/Thr protein kinase)
MEMKPTPSTTVEAVARVVRRSYHFAISDQTPSRARQALRNTLLAWEYPDEVASDAVLLLSELVTNAVQHAAGATECVVSVGVTGGTLMVEVRDDGNGLPTPRSASSSAEQGRGLGIVATLAERYGVRTDALGKYVFFTLSVPALPDGCRSGSSRARHEAGQPHLPQRNHGQSETSPPSTGGDGNALPISYEKAGST